MLNESPVFQVCAVCGIGQSKDSVKTEDFSDTIETSKISKESLKWIKTVQNEMKFFRFTTS